MNDPLAQLSSISTNQSGDPAGNPGGAKASPLDVLEEILKDAKQPGASKSDASNKAQAEEEALAQQQAREAEAAAQKAEDEAALQAKMAELEQMKVQAQSQSGESDQEQPDDGYQIVQLGHTKI